MSGWKSQARSTLSARKLWLRKVRATFHLYRRLVVVFLFVLVSCALIALNQVNSPVLRAIKSGVLGAVSPIVQVVTMPIEWVSGVGDYLESWYRARDQVKELVAQKQILEKRLSDTLSMEQENKALKSFLNVVDSLNHPFLTAKVFAYPGRPYINNVLLSAGQEQGVHLNQVAIDHRGLVGRIVDVTKGVSRVLLVTDLNSHIPVLLRGTKQQGILMGANKDAPFLKYVKEKFVYEGQVVETSGTGGIFPKGIPIGTISQVKQGHILVKPFSDVDHLTFVMLVAPSLEREIKNLKGYGSHASS